MRLAHDGSAASLPIWDQALVTGAADDDPSGISTYSVTGASFRLYPALTALFSFPLMVSVQLMCARLGMVTGRGLAGVLRRTYPRWVLWGACSLLIVANVVNIGADLGGMAEATGMVTGTNVFIWTPIYAVLIVSLLFSGPRTASSQKYLSGSRWCCLLMSSRLFSRIRTGGQCCGRLLFRGCNGPATTLLLL